MNNKMAYILMAFAATGAVMPNPFPEKEEKKLTPEERKRIMGELRRIRKRQQGLQEWDIDGVKVWALNRRNAERKARKINANPKTL